MSLLLGPGIGRLLPLPLLVPLAYEATVVACLVFPVIGVIVERRRTGATHPAWLWGIATIIASAALSNAIAYGPLGFPIYRAVTAGMPGAAVAPLEFPAPPAGPLRTGRPTSI